MEKSIAKAKSEPLRVVHNAQDEILYRTRSQEAQEIIGKMPPWIIRIGIGAILLLLLIGFAASALIKYPDTLSLNIILTPTNIPAKITAYSNGQIHSLLVDDGEWVKQYQPVLILGSKETFEYIQNLKVILQGLDTIIDFNNTYTAISIPAGSEIEKALPSCKAFLALLNKYHSQSVASEARLEYRMQIRSIADKLNEEQELWEQSNVLYSPTKGKTIFLKTLSPGTHILKGEDIIAVRPPDKSATTIATAFLPTANLEDIKLGCKISIKLSDYPVSKYGVLKGKVKSIPPIAFDGVYKIELELVEGLKTSLGYEIKSINQLSGIGEIEKETSQSIFQRIIGHL